ncbi:MAG: spore coat protein U domain-containing protein, partial [Deltaproteobacteria bacterium]|nr:spore coat protein U domain-containing protein [Deltaproteobacteria bacterium]
MARIALFLVFVFLLPAHLLAGSASTGLAVSVVVENTCAISTSAVNFGSYDPIMTHATSSLDGAGVVTITCT